MLSTSKGSNNAKGVVHLKIEPKDIAKKDLPFGRSFFIFKEITYRRGSDGSAAGGGRSDLSEWQRSIADEGFSKPRKISGTATGQSPTECEQEFISAGVMEW